MKIDELVNKVNAQANEVKGDKYSIKYGLEKLINKIFEEEGIEAQAYYEYGERSNTIKIKVKGVYNNEIFWPLYVTYKTSRKLGGYNRWTHHNDATYELKSISIYHDMEREIAAGQSIKIDTIEEFIAAEKYSALRRSNENACELETIRNYVNEHPEFKEMVCLYEKYKYEI